MKESPLFVRTHDFILWLISRTMDFPRSQRFVLTKRLQDAALDFQECIISAALSNGRRQAQHLEAADVRLAQVRFYLRLVHELGWLKPGQYAHAARMRPRPIKKSGSACPRLSPVSTGQPKIEEPCSSW